jgi:hypothetical protein
METPHRSDARKGVRVSTSRVLQMVCAADDDQTDGPDLRI